MLPAKAVSTSPHIDGFLFQRDVFCLIRLHTPESRHHMARCLPGPLFWGPSQEQIT